MTDITTPQRFERVSVLSFLGYLIGILILVWSFEGAGWSVERIMRAPPALSDFLSRSWPPSIDHFDRLG